MSRSWRGVREGTPIHGKSLCESCGHSHIVKGDAQSEQVIRCQAVYDAPIVVPFNRVVECNKYSSVTAPSMYDMEKMAYILDSDARGKPIGFLSNKEWRKQNPDDDSPTRGNPLVRKIDQ